MAVKRELRHALRLKKRFYKVIRSPPVLETSPLIFGRAWESNNSIYFEQTTDRTAVFDKNYNPDITTRGRMGFSLNGLYTTV